MSNTYVKFYENEYRTIEILVRDMNEEDYNIDYATCHIEDDEENIIMDETICMVTGNKIKITIPLNITYLKGIYYVRWTLHKDSLIFKHKTILNVEEL
jgi:hypothetical protein